MRQLQKIAGGLNSLSSLCFTLVIICGFLFSSSASASQQEPFNQSSTQKSGSTKDCVDKRSAAVVPCYRGTVFVVKSTGPSSGSYPVGFQLVDDSKIVLKKNDQVTVLTKYGTSLLKGPGIFTLAKVNAFAKRRVTAITERQAAERQVAERKAAQRQAAQRQVAERKSASSARLAAMKAKRNYARARTGAVRASGAYRPAPSPASAGIPVYPVWPPETPSSRVGLDRFIPTRDNMSLYNAGEKLKRAFEDAGYLEHSYYAVPGGFVLVTRIEKIATNGDALKGEERYRLPNQPRKSSLTDTIRNLFLDAPPGFYRYIAVVVSDEPYGSSGRRLTDTEAIKRLQRGSNNLSAQYKATRFTNDFKVEALIYEFRKNNQTGRVKMIAPGRLAPRTHLAKTRLDRTVAARFAR